MVKILANGDIVSDDYQTNEGPIQQHRSAMGRITSSNSDDNQPGEQRQSFLPVANIIEYVNQRLTAYGAPTFSLGQFTFKPIVSLGFLLATIIWGINGAVFSALLYFVVYFSKNAAPNIPFIRKLLQKIGLADQQTNRVSANRNSAKNSSSFDSSMKKSVESNDKSIKGFPGAGYKLN